MSATAISTAAIETREVLVQNDLHSLGLAVANEIGAAEIPKNGLNGAPYTALLDYLGSGVYRMTPQGQVVFANQALLRMLGFNSLRQLGRTRFDRSDVIEALAPLGQVKGMETVWHDKDGKALTLRESARTIRDGEGDILYIEGIVEDLPAARRAADFDRDHRRILDLVAANETLDTTLGQIGALVERQIPGSRCLLVLSRTGAHHTAPGAPLSSICSKGHNCTACSGERSGCSMIPFSATRKPYVAANCWWMPIRSGQKKMIGQIQVHHSQPCVPDEAYIHVLQTAVRLAGVAVQHRRLFDDLSRQATSDRATRLPNRYAFSDHLNRMLRKNPAGKIAVIWVGFDRFNGITETVGHRTSDALLRQVGQRITHVLKPSEWLARVGTDEFAIICDHADAVEAAHSSQRLLRALEKPFHIKSCEFFLSARIGIATAPGDGKTSACLQQNASAAYWRARNSGAMAPLFYDQTLSTNVRQRLEIENELRRAVQNHELRLFYQPQVNLERKLVGMEALLRWDHPVRGMLAPDQFIQIAEETGIIVEIGGWVIREACRQCAEWHRTLGLPIKVAVNVSALQLYFSDLPEIVRATLEETGLPANCFEIELTETVLMRNADDSAKALQKLRELGVTVAIDDFGTGYSSLSYLQKLPVDLLKIDRSFLQQIHINTTAAVVQAITTLAHSLGLRVAAEGIETDSQMECIRGVGVDIAQGFLIGRPMPPENAQSWMARS